jgi:hypothetical protein
VLRYGRTNIKGKYANTNIQYELKVFKEIGANEIFGASVLVVEILVVRGVNS